jgi:hypothetical protein
MWKLGNRTLKFCLKIMRPCSSISGDTEKSEPDTFILDSHRPFFCSDVQWNLGFFHEGLYFFWLSRRCRKVCLQQDEFFSPEDHESVFGGSQRILELTVWYNFRSYFKCKFDMSFYPFDIHQCSIKLTIKDEHQLKFLR